MANAVPVIIVFAYMALCLVLGGVGLKSSVSGGQAGQGSDYFLAGRQISPFLASMTYIATVFSALVFLGSVGSYYTLGVGFNIFLLSEMVIAAIFLPTIGKMFWKLAAKHDFVTPADLVTHRFGGNSWVRFLVGIITILFTFPFMAVQIVGISYVMVTATNNWLSYPTAVILISAVLAIYISLGGYRSVVWTDAIQVIALAAAMAVTFIIMIAKFDVVETFRQVQSLRGAIFTAPGPVGVYKPAFWITQFLMIGIGFVLMPQLWVRVYAVKKVQGLRHVVLYFIGATAVLFLFAFVFAVVCTDYYAGKNVLPDKLILTFMFEHVPRWLAATLLTGAIAASMSTIDSQVLCISSIVVHDFYSKLYQPDKPKNEVLWGRVISVLLLVICCILAFYPPPLFFGVLTDVMYPGMIALAPAGIISLFWKKASKGGAILSLAAGAILAVYLVATKQNPWGLYSGFWVFLVATFSLWLGSVLWPAQIKDQYNYAEDVATTPSAQV